VATHGRGVTTVAIAKTAPARIAKGKLGVYFAWGAFSKRDGEIFTDSHGDRIPDDELVAGALSLAKSAQLGHEHDGTLTGSVPLVMPLPEDIQAALEITSPHAGLAVGFQPSPAFAASLDAGDEWEMSIEGVAVAEMVKSAIAKSADAGGEIAKAEHKRTLRNLTINKIDLVKRGAHGAGTRIAIAKRAEPSPVIEVTKRTPAMTAAAAGHQHLIHDTEERDGFTGYEVAPGSEYGHSHPWIRLEDGSVEIGEAAGHTHTVEDSNTMADTAEINKSLAAAQNDVTKARALTAAVLSLSPAEFAYARRLSPDAVAAYVAKSAPERAELAKPVHVAKSGETFYSDDDARLVSMAKANDQMADALEAARASAATAEIAKSAAAVPMIKSADLIVGAIHKALSGEERKAALEALATANASIATVCQPIGSGVEPVAKSAEIKLEEMAAERARAAGVSFAKAYDDLLMTAEGAALYAQAKGQRKTPHAGN